MALFDLFKSKAQTGPRTGSPANFLNDQPFFSQFGDNIYASDVVQNCIDVIAQACSKLQPKHITISANGERRVQTSSINRLFKVAPNAMMTTRDFLEKIIWLLYLNYNAFVYPMYTTYDSGDGRTRKRFTGFYPLNPYQVDFEQDTAGTLYVHLYFKNGLDFQLRYTDVIHLRKKFSTNEVMGGGANGQPDNDALLKILDVNNTVVEGVGKAVSTSLAIRGIIKLNTMLDTESQQEERAKFEEALRTGTSGILPMDLKGEYTPISIDPKAIDKDTMEFLDSKVLRWYGVSLPIISGDFTDEQYEAFYEKTLEPLIISLGQAFTKTLFSEREVDVGNEIVFYQRNMMYLSTASKLNILKTAGEQGLLTDDQKLALLGYPPIGGEDGNRRTQSLNYVDVDLVNDYQMQKAAAPQINATGGGSNNG